LRRNDPETILMRPAFLDEFWRLTRFSMVGAVATVIHVVVAMLVISSTGISPTLGSIVGFFAAFTFSYLGHFRFSFAVVGRHRNFLLKFAVGSAVSFCLSTTVVWVCTAILKIHYKPTLIGIGFILPLCSYLINRFWVFFQPKDKSNHPLEMI
jgi:putative flippase GtrA